MLIGTAGHVNHGKTALIRALTGVDTDRLPEEKRRGLTIDLGFAYVERPDGRVIGFVDVPGHQSYLQNMIAGILQLDCVLLIVAADEGPKVQTIEHLEILRLIGVRTVIAILTKIDRIDSVQIESAEARLREELIRYSFGDAPVFPVSAATGTGLPKLQQYLDGLPDKRRHSSCEVGFRLPIDRVFTLAGVGTVVTGTIAAGMVHIGDKLTLTPSGLAVRVRSLHAQNRAASSGGAGRRCAVAISGPSVQKDRVRRGDVLTTPSLQRPTSEIGVRLHVAAGAALRNGREFHLYHGTGRTAVRVHSVGTNTAHFSLTSARPIAVLYGDRILLRDEVAKKTIAGGYVIAPFLPGRSLRREARARLLAAAARADHGDALAETVDAMGYADFDQFCIARNLTSADVTALLGRFAGDVIHARDTRVVISARVRELAKKDLVAGLAVYHEKYPQTLGPRRGDAMAIMRRQVADSAAEACLAQALAENCVIADGACIRLPSHRPHLAPEDQRIWNVILPLLQAAQLRPPHLGALASSVSVSPQEMGACLSRFAQFGLLTQVARNRFYLPETVTQLCEIARELVVASDGEGFTAAAFNDRTSVGRNLTIEVLEHLDAAGVTRRIGLRRHMC